MNIKIISDSTCDLSPELVAAHNITLSRLTVMKGDEQFIDGETITPADIFAHVAAGGSWRQPVQHRCLQHRSVR